VEQRLAKLEQQPAAGSSLGDNVQFSGLVEIEGAFGEGYDSRSYSDLTVATVELAIGAKLSKQVEAEVVLLYEQDETELDVDVATLSFDNIIGPVDLLIGKQYLPFGRFETALVNDTLALEIAETNKTAAVFGLEQDGLTVGAYLFDGSTDREKTVENWGVTTRYSQENVSVGADYISALSESDSFTGQIEDLGLSPRDVDGDDGALSLSGSIGVDALTVIFEYLRAVDEATVNGQDFQPEAFQAEVDLTADMSGKEFTFAFALQQSDDAAVIGLPETRISIGASTTIYENVGLGVEFWLDDDYGQNDGGSGDDSQNIVVQLAAEF
jgi:hypothetical protein